MARKQDTPPKRTVAPAKGKARAATRLKAADAPRADEPSRPAVEPKAPKAAAAAPRNRTKAKAAPAPEKPKPQTTPKPRPKPKPKAPALPATPEPKPKPQPKRNRTGRGGVRRKDRTDVKPRIARPLTQAKGRGRGSPGDSKSLYREDAHPQLARNFALLGMTLDEMAEEFGISIETLKDWRRRHPNLDAAIIRGGRAADGEVVAAMQMRAVGFEKEQLKIFQPKVITWKDKEGEMQHELVPQNIPYREYYPPDVRAGQYLLNNRRGRTPQGSLTWSGKGMVDGPDPADRVTFQVIFDPSVKPED